MSQEFDSYEVLIGEKINQIFGSVLGLLSEALTRYGADGTLIGVRDGSRAILSGRVPENRERTTVAAYLLLGIDDELLGICGPERKYQFVRLFHGDDSREIRRGSWNEIIKCCRQVADFHEARLREAGHPHPPRSWSEFAAAGTALGLTTTGQRPPWVVIEALRQKLILDRASGSGSRPPANSHPLLAAARSIRVKGKELEIVEMMVETDCKATLADYAAKLHWPNAKDNWNSARKALNKKLRPHGWYFNTEDSRPVFKFVCKQQPGRAAMP
jgi:hypothetical protein